MSFCSKCGMKIDESKNFCSKCGNKIIKNKKNEVEEKIEKAEFLPIKDITNPLEKNRKFAKRLGIISLIFSFISIIYIITIDISSVELIDFLFIFFYILAIIASIKLIIFNHKKIINWLIFLIVHQTLLIIFNLIAAIAKPYAWTDAVIYFILLFFSFKLYKNIKDYVVKTKNSSFLEVIFTIIGAIFTILWSLLWWLLPIWIALKIFKVI